jgi:hypothetical protein
VTQIAKYSCPYCQTECITSYILDDLVNFPRGPYIDYDCSHCQVHIRITSQGDMVYARWQNIKIKNESYFIIIIMSQDHNPTIEFNIYCMSHSTLKDWIKIKTFNFIPDWTPQNIVNKLGAYLPFL